MNDDSKVSFRKLAQDSLTVSHIEVALASESFTTNHIEKSLTTSHFQQRLNNATPVQPQGTNGQPSATTSASPIQTNQRK